MTRTVVVTKATFTVIRDPHLHLLSVRCKGTVTTYVNGFEIGIVIFTQKCIEHSNIKSSMCQIRMKNLQYIDYWLN
jgi:hypothetical protein